MKVETGRETPPKSVSKTPEDPALVRITSGIFENDLDLPLGPTPPTIASGYGGYQVIPRPRDVGISYWPGADPVRITVEVLIDKWTGTVPFGGGPNTVEKKVKKLLKLARDVDGEEPHPFRLYGLALPHNGWRWVIEGVEWGQTLRKLPGIGPERGLRRQGLTLTLMEYIEPGNLRLRRKKKRKRRRKRYTVKKGDTLVSIAAKLYGDWHKWKKIAKANNIRKSKARKLKPGKVLKIP